MYGPVKVRTTSDPILSLVLSVLRTRVPCFIISSEGPLLTLLESNFPFNLGLTPFSEHIEGFLKPEVGCPDIPLLSIRILSLH